MESCDGNGGNRLLLMTELSRIKELVTQLKGHLGGSRYLCKNLTAQIFSVAERSIGIITSADFAGVRKRSAADAGLTELTEVSSSLKTDNKKGKTTEKRKKQVRVSSAGGGEPPVDDGHSWRKYGQKEILGAKHPRGYYRCTHRHSQGCKATKQVQRTDEDPEIFDVFYVGAHTCGRKTETAANLTVKTEGLPPAAGEPLEWRSTATTPFYTSSTPASVCVAPERTPFSAPSTSENWGASPATSDSNHVASFVPPLEAGEWRARTELQEVVSALVVASTPPPVLGVDITYDELSDIDIDISSFFA